MGLDLASLGLALLALDEVRELVLGVVVGRDEVPLGRRARFEDLLVVLEIFQLLSRLRLVGLLVVGLAKEVLLEVIGGLWLSFIFSFRGIRRLLQPLLLLLALEAGDLVVLQEIVIFLVELERLLAPLSLLGRLVVGVVVVVVVVFVDDRGASAPAPHHRAIVVGVRIAEAEVRGGDTGGGLLGGRLGDRRPRRLGRGLGLGLGGLGRRRGAIDGVGLHLGNRIRLSLGLGLGLRRGLLALVARHGQIA